MNLKSIQKQAREEFDKKFPLLEVETFGGVEELTEDVKDFLDSAIEKAVKQALDMIAENEGWEESRDFYAKKLGLKTIYIKDIEEKKEII